VFNGNLIWICALPKDNRVNEVGDKSFNILTTPIERDKQCNGGMGKCYLRLEKMGELLAPADELGVVRLLLFIS
jgi:hypothetical protein